MGVADGEMRGVLGRVQMFRIIAYKLTSLFIACSLVSAFSCLLAYLLVFRNVDFVIECTCSNLEIRIVGFMRLLWGCDRLWCGCGPPIGRILK